MIIIEKHCSYCVEGTLAKEILGEPSEVVSQSGQRLPLRCTVEYISFSAHTDFEQTSHFIRSLRPPNVVLVHGERNEMGRLKSALEREYECNRDYPIKVFNPANLQTIAFHFKGDQMAKLMGGLVQQAPSKGAPVAGVLIKKNFKCQLVAPQELPKFTQLATSRVSQRIGATYTAGFTLLQYLLTCMFGGVEEGEKEGEGKEGEKEGRKEVLKVLDTVTVLHEPPLVVLEVRYCSICSLFSIYLCRLL